MNELASLWIHQQDTFLLKYIVWCSIVFWFIIWIAIWTWGRKSISFFIKIYKKYFSLEILNSFPKINTFLVNRFDNSKLSGLPLSLAFSVFITILLLLLGITEDFIEQDFIIQIDYWVSKNIASIRSELVVVFFHFFTFFGNGKFVFFVFIIILIFMVSMYNYLWLYPLIISIVGSMSTAWLSKYFFLRPRPLEALIIETSPSFPSGHATIAMSFYAVLFYLWWKKANSWNMKIIISFLGSNFVLLLAFSRIIMGVHYLTDVIAGLLLGGLWFVIALSLYEWLDDKKYIKLK